MSNYGFVYIMGNRAMPGIYKIGMTMGAPSKRAEELSSSTSVPLPFEVMAYGEAENPSQVERELHSGYADDRVSPSREFFSVPIESLIYILAENCNSVAVAYDRNDEFWRGK
jgi:hypothetical protein